MSSERSQAGSHCDGVVLPFYHHEFRAVPGRIESLRKGNLNRKASLQAPDRVLPGRQRRRRQTQRQERNEESYAYL